MKTLRISVLSLGTLLFLALAIWAQNAPARLPLIIAHRGGAKESTENTIAAFQRANRIGAGGIETDLRLTRDGVVVIYHDERYGRVEGIGSNSTSPLLSDMTLAELTARTLKPVGDDQGGRRVPTLAELLNEVNAGLLNIEIKRGARFDELVERTIAILRASPALSRVVLEPPDLATAVKLRAGLGDGLRLHINPAYDSSVSFDESLKRVLAFKPHSISVSYRRLSWEIVDVAHKAGVEVWVWTVDQPEIAQAMTLLGVDAIKTDVPTTMIRLLKKPTP